MLFEVGGHRPEGVLLAMVLAMCSCSEQKMMASGDVTGTWVLKDGGSVAGPPPSITLFDNHTFSGVGLEAIVGAKSGTLLSGMWTLKSYPDGRSGMEMDGHSAYSSHAVGVEIIEKNGSCIIRFVRGDPDGSDYIDFVRQ
jgi:hypothetical protein